MPRPLEVTIDHAKDKSSGKRRKHKKEPFLQRLARQGRETIGLASILVNDPRAFPAALLGKARRGFRAVWSARGGGLYACGFLVTFIYLEIVTLVTEIASAEGVGSFITEQLFEFFIRFTLQSLQNTIQSFLWPLSLIEWSEVWGPIILGVLYIVFPRYIKEPLTEWLRGDDDDAKDA